MLVAENIQIQNMNSSLRTEKVWTIKTAGILTDSNYCLYCWNLLYRKVHTTLQSSYKKHDVGEWNLFFKHSSSSTPLILITLGILCPCNSVYFLVSPSVHKHFNLGHNLEWLVIWLPYFICIFLVTRPFLGNKFWLLLDFGVGPTFEKR